MLALELLDEVVDETVIEILTSLLPSETETVDDNSCVGGIQKIEAGTSERGVEAEGVHLNGEKGKLGTLASGAEGTENAKVRRDSLRKGRLYLIVLSKT